MVVEGVLSVAYERVRVSVFCASVWAGVLGAHERGHGHRALVDAYVYIND